MKRERGSVLSDYWNGHMAKGVGMGIEYRINRDLKSVRPSFQGNPWKRGRYLYDVSRGPESSKLTKIARWLLSRNPQRKEKKEEGYELEVIRGNLIPDGNSLCWLGHSSFMIRIGGRTILTDPVFFDLPMYRRLAVVPFQPGELPPVDYLLVSHNHRDHFDPTTIRRLPKHAKSQALIPLGLVEQLSWFPVQEAAWYQEYALDDHLRIIFLPAKHWSRRSLSDTNRSLWGSFLILGDGVSIFFAGDTARDDQLFSEIRETIFTLTDHLDVCLMPIGAYKPPYIMQSNHTSPEEAWGLFELLGGRYCIPMHYGTYDLSDEPIGEPIRLFYELQDQRGVVLSPGEFWWPF